jgi:hypothetical protein
MAADNLFQKLRRILQNYKDFLDANVPTLKPALQALSSLTPQISDAIDTLIDLMSELKAIIQNLDVGSIPGLQVLSSFTEKTKAVLLTSRCLLLEQRSEIASVICVSDILESLPHLEEIKGEIIALIEAIIAHLNSLKS